MVTVSEWVPAILFPPVKGREKLLGAGSLWNKGTLFFKNKNDSHAPKQWTKKWNRHFLYSASFRAWRKHVFVVMLHLCFLTHQSMEPVTGANGYGGLIREVSRGWAPCDKGGAVCFALNRSFACVCVCYCIQAKAALKFPSFSSEQQFPEPQPGKCVSAWQRGCGKTMGQRTKRVLRHRTLYSQMALWDTFCCVDKPNFKIRTCSVAGKHHTCRNEGKEGESMKV